MYVHCACAYTIFGLVGVHYYDIAYRSTTFIADICMRRELVASPMLADQRQTQKPNSAIDSVNQ